MIENRSVASILLLLMTTILDFAKVANDVYKGDAADTGRAPMNPSRTGIFQRAADNSEGFQGGIYESGEDVIVGFRGTADWEGVKADASIFLRRAPRQLEFAIDLFDAGTAFHRQKGHAGNLYITCHSLGGFLTQLVCAWEAQPGVAFNAAGARGLTTGRLWGLEAALGFQGIVPDPTST
jgi:hypothetical protein